jgi:tetratricopeptide (TPR) repeat protein
LAHPEVDWQISEVTARIEDRGDDTALWIQRGELHRVDRDWAAAEADFLKARQIDPELDVIDFHIGRMKLEAGDYAAALKALDRYVSAHPDHSAALVARARTRAAVGRNLDAARDFTRALAVTDRPQPTHYLERARALANAGDKHLAKAVAGLDEGSDRLHRPITLELEAIELEVRRKKYNQALTRIDRIAAASARQEAWLIRRAEIMEQAGRPDEARVAYRASLDAIESLPASRRWNRAVQRLQTQAESAIARLDAEP